MDDYSLRLFPGISHRPPPRSSSITYVNGVPVQVNGNDLVRAHPIPATAVPKGRMSVPLPPGYQQSGVHVLQPNEAVTWDPVIGQYRLVQRRSGPPLGYQTPFGYNFDDFDHREPPSPMIRFGGPQQQQQPPPQQYFQTPPPQQQQQHTPKGLARSQSFPPPPQDQYLQNQQQQYQQQQYLQQQRDQQQRDQQLRDQQLRDQQLREQQQREQQQREQQQREQQQREQQQREQQQRDQQLLEQQQREKQKKEQQLREQQQIRDQQLREQQQIRDQQLREQQQRDKELKEKEERKRIEQQQQKERELKEKQDKEQYSNIQSNNNLNAPTLIKSNSFHSTPGSTSSVFQRKDLEPLEPPHNIAVVPTPSSSVQQKQEKVKQDKSNIAKEYPIENKLNNLKISSSDKPTTNELNQRKRMKSLNELLSTEESYSDSLEKLILYYKLPLESKLNSKEMEGITQSDVNSLFSNVEALLVISKDLLIKLKYEFSLPQDQQKIGDLYIEKSKEMKLYVAYINNYELAMDELKKIEDASPKFFKDCQSKYKYSLDIRSLLIMPVQRIPRYELLFREILKYTDQSGPEYQKLLEAHQSIHQINDYINNNKRLRENKDRVVTISNELKGCPSSLLKSSRRWIKEGILDITCSNKKYNGQFNVYLFNDLIVLGKHKTFRSKIIEYFAEINLDKSEFKEIPGNPTKFRFISDPEGRKPLIFTFEAENEKIKDSWIKNLKLLDEERKLSNISPR